MQIKFIVISDDIYLFSTIDNVRSYFETWNPTEDNLFDIDGVQYEIILPKKDWIGGPCGLPDAIIKPSEINIAKLIDLAKTTNTSLRGNELSTLLEQLESIYGITG